MINNKRPITSYEFDLIEFIRTKLKEDVEQRTNKNRTHYDNEQNNE